MATASTLSNCIVPDGYSPHTVDDCISKDILPMIQQIKDKFPFVAFMIIATEIEFLGTCVSEQDYNDDKNSANHFVLALETFPSLKKYSNITIPEISEKVKPERHLYNALRCGLVHCVRPNGGLILSEGRNDLPRQIGLQDFVADFITACQDLSEGKVAMGLGKSINDVYYFVKQE